MEIAYYIKEVTISAIIEGEIYVKLNHNIFENYKNYLYSYNYPTMNNAGGINATEVPLNTENGFLELFVFTDRGQVPIEGAIITIYARQGEVNDVPVVKILSEKSPITIELPVAHPLGTPIKGPEYYYTTYNMTIEKPGFYAITVKNIRMFPGITAQFSYNLNRVLPGVPGRQETIAIPTHPRDIVQ